VYLTPQPNPRLPASVQKLESLPFIDSTITRNLSKKNIILGSRLEKVNGDIKIFLGQFKSNHNHLNPVFSCNVYNKIELTFHSEGISFHGAPSELRITANCKLEKNLSQVSLINIPFSKIMKLSAQDKILNYKTGNLTSVEFINLGGEWPDTWALYNVKFYNSQSKELRTLLDPDEVFNIQKKRLTIHL